MELLPADASVLIFVKVFSDVSSLPLELLDALLLLSTFQTITVITLNSEEFPELLPVKAVIVIEVILVEKLAALTVVSFLFLIFTFFPSDECQVLIVIKRFITTAGCLALLLDLVHTDLLEDIPVGSEHILALVDTQLVISVRVKLVEDILGVSFVNVKTVAWIVAASWVDW